MEDVFKRNFKVMFIYITHVGRRYCNDNFELQGKICGRVTIIGLLGRLYFSGVDGMFF